MEKSIEDMEELNDVVDRDDFEEFKRTIEKDDYLPIEILGKTVSSFFSFLVSFDCLRFVFFVFFVFLCFIFLSKIQRKFHWDK